MRCYLYIGGWYWPTVALLVQYITLNKMTALWSLFCLPYQINKSVSLLHVLYIKYAICCFLFSQIIVHYGLVWAKIRKTKPIVDVLSVITI